MVKLMNKNHETIEKIQLYTGLSKEEIIKIIDSL